jgi:hypothetical protein
VTDAEAVPAEVIAIGREQYDGQHYGLTFEQGRFFLWGFDGDPTAMMHAHKRYERNQGTKRVSQGSASKE